MDANAVTKVNYSEVETSQLPEGVPEESPQQDAMPQESPLQDVVPQESPLQDVVPQELPLQDAVPQELPLQDVVPQAPPLQDVVPQGTPLHDVVPQESPHPNVAFQESPQQNVAFQESPKQDVAFQESRKQDELPQVPSQQSTLLLEPTLPSVGTQESLLQDMIRHKSWVEENKKRRVREACRRLKLQEQKAREELLRQMGRSSQIEASLLEKIETIVEIELSPPSTTSTQSETSTGADNTDDEDGREDEQRRMIERASYTSDVSLRKFSITSDDPMKQEVEDLMLVPSISDLSLSDEIDLKSIISQKSFYSDKILTQENSDSVESESGLSGEMRDSLEKLDNDRVDDSLTLNVIEEDEADEDDDIFVDDIVRSKKSLDFEEFMAGNLPAVRSSSIIDKKPVDIHSIPIVTEFINMLIEKVVSVDPDQIIRNKLDKTKLHNGIKQSLAEHMQATIINVALNELMVEYYKLNKNIRVFAELSAQDRQDYYNRYRNGLASVAFGEQRVALAKLEATKVTVRAQLELNNATLIASGTEHHFEQTVRRILLRPDSESDQLKRLIARELRLMEQHRTEISYNRTLLIMLKHDLGKFLKEIEKLNTVGDHVTMDDFLNLQAKVIGLQMKINERNADLKKMRGQYHKELHLAQHTREKVLVLRDKLSFRQEQLPTKYEKRNYLRQQVYIGKMQRKSMQAKTKELAYQGGILSTPSLMYDYDRTMIYIRQKQEVIAGLKETVRSLNQRLISVCPKGSQINVNSISQ